MNTPINNQQLTDELEKRVEAQLREAIRTFQNLEEHVLLNPSATGGWSIAQCLEHLNTYGRYYLPYLEKSLQQAPDCTSSIAFKSGLLGNYFTNLMEPVAGMKTMQAAKLHIPGTVTDAHAVVAEFIQQLEILLAYIRRARQKNLNKSTIPVSIFKWVKLNPGDVLRFLVAHNERHIQQAKRSL